MPFDPFDRDSLLEHFHRHGAEVGASTPDEYEAMADAFLLGERPGEVKECRRPPPKDATICRYSPVTEEYGVKQEGAYIITYFIPVPMVEHRFATNLEYFRHKCR